MPYSESKEHIKLKEIMKKKLRLSKIYERHTGKTSLSSLDRRDFSKIQTSLLRELRAFLKTMKQYTIKQK